ncbi:MAG TPA: gliding motility-associated ABC transporter permease subunit GldF [Paludibacteraceae bacterium]|jgi:ABC-2 type transport system permease protein|nr:gliding motility-associated ABC transporter permease subunit GldF [Paludibacteraceae bacterium]HPD59140.1 gliding motility-associated ABC transporter permease subunit GldF [Paludibacteraceae bacterium]HRS23824.1 gliding motility-associated ABC transporter permease subunit GldF [Paludibacteraceae bacterium]HRT78273.1 gliding motility-associated ABC transporter permease subunit GldF [Paludibacteraceae bacterium]
MISIFKKELGSFFSSATGYLVIGIFLALTGLFLWVIPGEFNILESGYANVDGLFYLAPWLFLFLCPAITMRSFAEEKKSGTWEILITKPLSITELVLGKFLAGWILVLIALFPTVLYYFSVYFLAEPVGNIDAGAFWGSFIGLIFLSGVYIAIGIFSSSLSNNQIISFVVSVLLCFIFFYGFDLLGSFFSSGAVIDFVQNLGINAHYKSMSRGVLDMRDVGYFLFLGGLFLGIMVWKNSKSDK